MTIGLSDGENTVTDGDTVNVTINRDTAATTAAATSTAITIPIVAIKITPSGPVVFTASSTTLVANPITLGAIFGSSVTIASGVTPDMDIVTDARGLSAGETVVIN